MKHLVNWIEIPVTDMNRAIKFYSAILGVEFFQMPLGNNEYALFPCDDKHNTGALAKGGDYKPSANGITIYLDGGKDLSTILSKVNKAGGSVLLEKTFLGDQAGYVGLFLDSEGNKIGLQHS